jgi:hypothetical protein
MNAEDGALGSGLRFDGRRGARAGQMVFAPGMCGTARLDGPSARDELDASLLVGWRPATAPPALRIIGCRRPAFV